MEFFSQPASWTLVAFIIFIAIAIYLKVPSMVTKLLDEQIKKVEQELSDAIKLKEEANSLLAEYQRKKEAAEKEAENIISSAKDRAKAYETIALSKGEEMVRRQEAQSIEKINQAQIQAIARIRETIIEKSIDSAEKLVSKNLSSEKTDKIFTDSLKDLEKLKI
jgi:F-type H+-transporting ATPase subunit b